MLTKDFIGMEVFDLDLRKIGKIKDLDIEKDTLQVNSLIVELDDEIASEVLGEKQLFKKSVVTISRSFIEKVGDVVILKNSIKELKNKLEKFKE
ncbi:MAG: PRC-barrel domain-containing protein [Candidatus Bathyarchaeia archaeon]